MKSFRLPILISASFFPVTLFANNPNLVPNFCPQQFRINVAIHSSVGREAPPNSNFRSAAPLIYKATNGISHVLEFRYKAQLSLDDILAIILSDTKLNGFAERFYNTFKNKTYTQEYIARITGISIEQLGKNILHVPRALSAGEKIYVREINTPTLQTLFRESTTRDLMNSLVGGRINEIETLLRERGIAASLTWDGDTILLELVKQAKNPKELWSEVRSLHSFFPSPSLTLQLVLPDMFPQNVLFSLMQRAEAISTWQALREGTTYTIDNPRTLFSAFETTQLPHSKNFPGMVSVEPGQLESIRLNIGQYNSTDSAFYNFENMLNHLFNSSAGGTAPAYGKVTDNITGNLSNVLRYTQSRLLEQNTESSKRLAASIFTLIKSLETSLQNNNKVSAELLSQLREFARSNDFTHFL